jgi:hypothetical protein
VARSPDPPSTVQTPPHPPPPRRVSTPTLDGFARFLRACVSLARGRTLCSMRVVRDPVRCDTTTAVEISVDLSF